MNMIFVLCATLALTAAAPSGEKPQKAIEAIESRAEELAAIRRLPALEHDEVHDKFGQYALRYVTAEGIVVSERGRLVPNIEGDGYVLITEGEISYIGDDGKEYVTKFTAGLDGYHAEGNHLPVPPMPIVPEAESSESPKAKPTEAIPGALPAVLSIIE